MEAPAVLDEAARLRDLYSVPLLTEAPDENFDRLTRLAAETLEVPIALVSIVDASHQWFRSRVGIEAAEADRYHTFCAHTIAEGGPLVIEDAAQDHRFASNAVVAGHHDIGLYVGVPLAGPTGRLLGTLCVVDTEPRRLAPARLNILCELGRVVERELSHIHRANSDPVTGLATRAVLLDGGARLRANDQAGGRPTSALVVSIERLEPINQRWGYAAGDQAITELAEAMTGALRSADLVARLPGAKLAAILPDTGEAELAEVAVDVELAFERAHRILGVETHVGSVTLGMGERLADALVRAELVASVL